MTAQQIIKHDIHIVKSDRVHVFEGKEWDTEAFEVSGVYAIGFKDGIVKFGRSKNVRSRLKSYSTTGNALTAEFYLVRVHPTPNSAERDILAVANATLEQAGAPECFYCGKGDAVAVLSTHSEPIPQHGKEVELGFVGQVVRSDGSVVPLDLFLTELHDFPIIKLVLAMESMSLDEDSVKAIIGVLSEPQLLTFTLIVEKNAVLIGRGVEYDDRKKMLEQHALDLKTDKQLIPPS